MPTYEYVCRECGQHLEVVQSFTDDPLNTCEQCGGSLRKVFSAAGIIFKGSGYYVTDNRSDRAGASSPSDGSEGSSKGDGSTKESSGDGGSSDSSSKDGASSGSTTASDSSGSSPSKPSKSDVTSA